MSASKLWLILFWLGLGLAQDVYSDTSTYQVHLLDYPQDPPESRPLWSQAAEGALAGDQRIYLLQEGKLRAFELAGTPVFSAGAKIAELLGSGAGQILVRPDEGGIWALDAQSGREAWRALANLRVYSVLFAEGRLLYQGGKIGAWTPVIGALDPQTGRELWRAEPSGMTSGLNLHVQQGVVVIAGSLRWSFSVQGYDLRAGHLLWDQSGSLVAIEDERVYLRKEWMSVWSGASPQTLLTIGLHSGALLARQVYKMPESGPGGGRYCRSGRTVMTQEYLAISGYCLDRDQIYFYRRGDDPGQPRVKLSNFPWIAGPYQGLIFGQFEFGETLGIELPSSNAPIGAYSEIGYTRGNSWRDGFTMEIAGRRPREFDSLYYGSGAAISYLTIAGERLYLGRVDGRAEAYDLESSKLLWAGIAEPWAGRVVRIQEVGEYLLVEFPQRLAVFRQP